MRDIRTHRPWMLACCAAGAMLTAGTGCQVHVNGQTLPSPWYWKDDVQYYAPGPEFKLLREAAAMKEFRETQASNASEEQ